MNREHLAEIKAELYGLDWDAMVMVNRLVPLITALESAWATIAQLEERIEAAKQVIYSNS